MLKVEKFKNKYKIESTRLWHWDYSENGVYFVTICTQNREHYFGEIINSKMELSQMGRMAQYFWQEIPKHFPYIKLDEFVVMPNHVHGILVIDKNTRVETLQCNVSTTAKTTNIVMPIKKRNAFYAKISPKPQSLPTIIRSYKSVCTKNINKIQNKIFFS